MAGDIFAADKHIYTVLFPKWTVLFLWNWTAMNRWRLGAVLTINESHVHHDKQLLKNLLKLKLFENLKKN